MAQAFYVNVTGQKQGAIKGDVTAKGHEGSILGWALSHEILSPRDAASGLATGKRMHKPLTITTPWGSATPKLLTAMYNNENLTSVLLRFSRIMADGKDTEFMTIELTKASVSDLVSRVPNVTDPNMKMLEYHEISFTYQKIKTTYLDGAIVAMDSWEAPV